MLSAVLSLFNGFNPVIMGLLFSAGAYMVLRHRTWAAPRVVPVAPALASRLRALVFYVRT